MQKLLMSLLTILILTSPALSQELNKGDKLQILYYRVWAYTNPDDVSTHIGPYSYHDEKVTYLGINENHPDFLFVKTPDGKEAFIRRNLIADDVNVTKEKVFTEIENGERQKSQYGSIKINIFKEMETWQLLLLAAVFLIGLYLFWKKFFKIDAWFLRRSNNTKRQIQRPWFINYSAISGGIIGACLTLFKPAETEWFLNEGIRLWTNYSSFWDWLLWLSVVFFSITLIASIIHPFFRLKSNVALQYSIMSLITSAIYFLAGLITGGLVAVLIIIGLFIMSSDSTQTRQATISGPDAAGYRKIFFK